MATALSHRKLMIVYANNQLRATNIDPRVYCFVCTTCSPARCIFCQSAMFDIFKSQQGVAQKPHLSAKNDNNFKAACGVLTISNIRDPQKDALFQAPYFVYQTLNYRKNIQNLKRGNRLAQTWTEPAGSRFSWNCYSRNSPETEPFVTLG